MSKFYEYHPGSTIGTDLFNQRQYYRDLIVSDPSDGVALLVSRFGFGKKSDFWDDHIFNLIISHSLEKIVSLEISLAVNTYSTLDHALFLTYIRRDEDPNRFRRAFWNVNHYGVQIANRFHKESYDRRTNTLSNILIPKISNKIKTIAFLFKGPFSLAHSEFFEEFLVGSKFFQSCVHVSLILLDDVTSSLKLDKLSHITIHSLSSIGDTYSKLVRYSELASSYQYDHISWIACVQNLGLFMGSRFAPSQSYWSMKYHSIIMSSLDKYAGLGFGGDSFFFDDTEWFRGRAFPDLSFPDISLQHRNKLLMNKGIPLSSKVAGCFVRSEKLNNYSYWLLIEKLLDNLPELHFVIASQSLPDVASSFLAKDLFINRFHHLGWVNTKEWCQCLDIYIDSFPRGSCLTALESIKANVPLIMFDSEHNRESSALPYLVSANNQKLPIGVLTFESVSNSADDIVKLFDNESDMRSMAVIQKNLLNALEGRRVLYAKDYLNYLLDLNLNIKEVSS